MKECAGCGGQCSVCIYFVKGLTKLKALTCMKIKMAILSRRLAILLYEQLIHHKINLHIVFEYSAAWLSIIFELLPGLIPFAS